MSKPYESAVFVSTPGGHANQTRERCDGERTSRTPGSMKITGVETKRSEYGAEIVRTATFADGTKAMFLYDKYDEQAICACLGQHAGPMPKLPEPRKLRFLNPMDGAGPGGGAEGQGDNGEPDHPGNRRTSMTIAETTRTKRGLMQRFHALAGVLRRTTGRAADALADTGEKERKQRGAPAVQEKRGPAALRAGTLPPSPAGVGQGDGVPQTPGGSLPAGAQGNEGKTPSRDHRGDGGPVGREGGAPRTGRAHYGEERRPQARDAALRSSPEGEAILQQASRSRRRGPSSRKKRSRDAG